MKSMLPAFPACTRERFDDAVRLPGAGHARRGRGAAARRRRRGGLLAGGTDLLVQMREHVRRPAQVDQHQEDSRPGRPRVRRARRPRDAARWRRRARWRPPRRCGATMPACTPRGRISPRSRCAIGPRVVGNVCRASPSADTLPPLIADGATLRVHGTDGVRDRRARGLLHRPGPHPPGADELVTRIRVPAPRAAHRQGLSQAWPAQRDGTRDRRAWR